jgi:hypothetical protein
MNEVSDELERQTRRKYGRNPEPRPERTVRKNKKE